MANHVVKAKKRVRIFGIVLTFIDILKNMSMAKEFICLILTICTISICFSQTDIDKSMNNCYSEKVRLNTVNKEFKDTIIILKNYINDNDEKRIICNNLITDKDIDKMIWESKYIAIYLQYQNSLNKFSIISYSYESDKKNRIIASYFLCDRESKETIEMIRFQIDNKKIIGINVFPIIINKFTPIDEYEKIVNEYK